MSNVKICNLDLIAPVQNRELRIAGQSYEVLPLSIERFIELQQLRQSVSVDDDVIVSIEKFKQAIKSSVPSIPDEILGAFTVEQLQVVVAFVFDEIPDSVLNPKPKKKAKEAEGAKKNEELAEESAGK